MARLVENRMEIHWFFEQLSEAELAQVRSMAEHAFALAPDLAEVHVALGDFYYHGYRQYEQALAEFERALQLQPNSSTALAYLGYVHGRQGQWEHCLASSKKLSNRIRATPRSRQICLPLTFRCGCGKK